MKKKVTEWEKISVNHIRDNGLEYIRRKFNQKSNQLENGQKTKRHGDTSHQGEYTDRK